MAVNSVEELKYRIQENDVVKFDQIHASSTVGREDGTFGFSFIHYTKDFNAFDQELKQEIEAVRNSKGLRLNENVSRLDTIHYSTLPWHKFTGLTHARSFNTSDSSPKITFGRAFTIEGKMMLPVSIDAHHGLVDGIHVSQFLNEFQKLMNE
jgi:chloramphenicol O-acetyltransferase type A